MRNEHALRYLLLRHIRLFKGQVPDSVFREVADSLQVATNRDSYIVTWNHHGKPKTRQYRSDDFLFYMRGDTRQGVRSVNDGLKNSNDALARLFVGEAFGSPSLSEKIRLSSEEPIEPYLIFATIENIALALSLILLGRIGYFVGLLLLILLLSEYLKRGPLYASCVLVILSLFGLQGSVFLGALVYAIFHFLDLDPTNRVLRACMSVGAAGVALIFSLSGLGEQMHLDRVSCILICYAVAIAFARSLVSIHFRKLPFAVPFVCAGLALNGHTAASIIGFSVITISTIARFYIHKYFPVQREVTSSPNG